MKKLLYLVAGMLLFICCLLVVLSCNKKQPKETVAIKQTTKKTLKGTVELTLDGKTYVYDAIDWKKSRIKNEEDISLSIWQEGLPKIMFRFPDIEKSLADGQDTFKIPDVHRRGFSPITLNFIVTIKDKKREAVTFRKGQVKAGFKNNHLQIEFDGQGGLALDRTISYPIKGIINLNI